MAEYKSAKQSRHQKNTDSQTANEQQIRHTVAYTREAVQCRFTSTTVQRQDGATSTAPQLTIPPNRTGLPDRLKTGVENLSGYAMDDVKVHYNSPKPARFNALAYTHGSNIYVCPRQERHLPHEAWHVVQQKQGRVKPTMQMKGVGINDDGGLEREADVMGTKSLGLCRGPAADLKKGHLNGTTSIQAKVGFEFEDSEWNTWISTFLWGGWFRDRIWKEHGNKQGVEPAKKKEILHNATGFNVEADMLPPASDMEFVTDAFEENDAGRRQLNQTLDGIATIYERLDGLAGRDHKKGEFVTASESGFSNNKAMLSGGKPGGKIKMQVTQGIPLEELPTLMKYFGTGVHETARETGYRRPARRAMHGAGREDTDDFYSRLLGESPAMADAVIAHLHGNPVILGPLAANSAKLRGFLSLVMNYVRAFSFLGLKAGSKRYAAAKHRTMLMARTDVASIFTLLPEGQRVALIGERDTLKECIISVANARRTNEEEPYTLGQPFLRGITKGTIIENRQRNVAIFPELTLGNWLDGILDGTDLANEPRIKTWLAGNAGGLSQEDIDDRGLRLRGLGGLDDLMDRRDNHSLPILENRGLIPGGPKVSISFALAARVARNYFEFLVALREGREGPFPEEDVFYSEAADAYYFEATPEELV